MSQLQPIFHPSPKLSYFFDTREIIRSSTFRRLLALGLIGMSGSDVVWRPTEAGLSVLQEHPQYVKQAIVEFTFADSTDSGRWLDALKAGRDVSPVVEG